MNAVESLLGEAAQSRHGERLAFICGEESKSYAQLAREVQAAAAALAALGVVPGDRVLLLMRDTPEFAAAWLGVVRLGAVAVALNDKLSEAEYRHILADCAARLALVEERFANARPDLSAELARDGRLALVGSHRAGVPEWRELVARQHAGPEAFDAAFDASPDTPAFALYSSGTTGRPKGILHSHKSILCAGAGLRLLGINPSERVFATSRLFFAYGLEHGFLGTLALGATSILCPDWPDAAAVIATTARHKPAVVFSVPTIYRRLLAEPHERLAPFREVRHFVSAGERLSAQLVEQWKAAAGAELLNLYGMSETFCACLLTRPGTSNGARTGEPLAGVEVRLLDESDREPAAGEPGVLWLRHPAQAAGYANLPEQTRAQFKDGWFCSRDVFVRDAEGFLVHQGRSDELVKIAGQWVQPGELEEAVAEVAGILEAACVALPDEDGLERLALFVAASGDLAAAARAAAELCERALPRYKRPKWVRAVNELPRTATGKVQRYKLREILEREAANRG